MSPEKHTLRDLGLVPSRECPSTPFHLLYCFLHSSFCFLPRCSVTALTACVLLQPGDNDRENNDSSCFNPTLAYVLPRCHKSNPNFSGGKKSIRVTAGGLRGEKLTASQSQRPRHFSFGRRGTYCAAHVFFMMINQSKTFYLFFSCSCCLQCRQSVCLFLPV